MPIALRPSAGTKVFVSAGAPTAFTTAAYGLLTWTQAEGFDQVGEIGRTDEVGNFDSLTEGRIKFRSISDAGEIEATPADLPGDAGQIIMRTAHEAAKGSAAEKISLRIEDAAGYGTYAQVMVSRWTRTYGGATDVQIRNATLPILTGTVVEYTP